MLAVLVLLAVLVVAVAYVARSSDPERRGATDAGFEAALGQESSALNRALLNMARPVAGLSAAHLREESGSYKALRTKLAASGNMFGGQVPVFLSVQILVLFVAALTFVSLLAFDVSGVMLAVGALGAVLIAYYPYHRVSEAANKRMELVDRGMPEFAELLLMPLSSGYGILPALDFTAGKLDGPVSDEVRAMLELVQNRVRTEAEAFTDVAERLGTPASMSFFTALSQAYLEGVSVVDTLRGQAEQLRKQEYERTRAKLKTLPNKLTLVIGIHLIPTLLIIVLFPTFASLAMI